jgi:purine-binding chemotaxis protein CheW
MNIQSEADKKTTELVEPNEVLTDYLNALLSEVETVELAETAPVPEVVTEVVAPSVVAEVARVEEVSEPQQDVLPDTTMGQEEVRELAIETKSWPVTDEFQILLFQVAGITLAVSLEKLGGILEWNEDVTPMPNCSPWFLGLLAERGEQIKVIDTGMLVVPSKFRANHHREDMQKIILIGDGKWGLACDNVSEVITLHRDKVRWRGENSKRPWLAGTVVDQMCALLDVDKFVELLSSEQLEPAG